MTWIYSIIWESFVDPDNTFDDLTLVCMSDVDVATMMASIMHFLVSFVKNWLTSFPFV